VSENHQRVDVHTSLLSKVVLKCAGLASDAQSFNQLVQP
jgi:hypothetical protein